MAYTSTSLRFLRVVRYVLIIFSTLVFCGLVYRATGGFLLPNGDVVSFFQVPVRATWYIWLHLALSLVAATIYSVSMRSRSYVSRGTRLTVMFLYSCLWTVFPSYRINTLRRYSTTPGSFFDNWFCDSTTCRVLVAVDILSYLVAILAVTEVYFADRYEAPYLYGKQAMVNTTIILAPVVTTAPSPYQPVDGQAGYQPYPQQQAVDGSAYYTQAGYSAPPATSGYTY
ncbi:hypothetical protein DFQ26_006370 [Actinomortierella ambigua]|nr:hypothetical protein DFQ26_006370 [Actinomortierella ambigua]